MDPFKTHRGKVAILDRANVDTDAIIPKQFLKSIKRTGFGPSAFFQWRYLDNGDENPEFELNHPRYAGRSVLVTRNNFGCGSSREHAVWAIRQDGYQVLVAPRRGEGDACVPGFADIFRNNCLKNGVLAIELNESQVDEIFALVREHEGLEATANLEEQTLTFHAPAGDKQFAFEINGATKAQLISGQDDIDMTLENLESIDAFESVYNNQLAGSFE